MDQWIAVHDLVDDGLLNDSVERETAIVGVAARPGSRGYTHTAITGPDGRSLTESYLISGMGHSWPGPHGRGLFSDGAGPDAGPIIWEFARRHPMPGR